MSDKKRLEAVDERLRETNELEHSESGEVHVVFEKGDIEWLIQQSERVQEMEDAVYATGETYRQEREYNQRLEKENAQLREALKDIASEDEWETVDEARNIARRALEGETE